MTVSTATYLKGFYDKTRALGAKSVNSDFTFEIEGYESSYLLAKQAPWPVLSSAGEIDIATPLGANMWQPQQLKVAQQGQVALHETVAGAVDSMLLDILTKGGIFNAKVYEGTPQKYVRYKRLEDCFLQLDSIDRDWENRSQVLIFQGTLFFHYFGVTVRGGNSL